MLCHTPSGSEAPRGNSGTGRLRAGPTRQQLRLRSSPAAPRDLRGCLPVGSARRGGHCRPPAPPPRTRSTCCTTPAAGAERGARNGHRCHAPRCYPRHAPRTQTAPAARGRLPTRTSRQLVALLGTPSTFHRDPHLAQHRTAGPSTSPKGLLAFLFCHAADVHIEDIFSA